MSTGVQVLLIVCASIVLICFAQAWREGRRRCDCSSADQ